MVSIFSKARRSPLLLLILVIVVCLCISVVHGQEDSTEENSDLHPSPEESEESPSSPPPPSHSPDQPPIATPSPSPSPSPAPATPPGTAPGSPPSSPGTPVPPAPATPAAPGTPGVPVQPPNPIFSTSDTCVACQKEFPAIRNCTAMLPPPSVNLTIISQILPFYKCMCQNEGVEIVALQQCSNCFRSTGQRAFLSGQFYNVTNQQVKAMKQVCEKTEGGTRLPTSGTGAGTRGLILQTPTGWYFVLAFVSALFLVPGCP